MPALDCGNGVFGKLRAAATTSTVDAVVVSHMHADHFLDLVPFAYALTTRRASSPCRSTAGPARPAGPPAPLRRAPARRVVGTCGRRQPRPHRERVRHPRVRARRRARASARPIAPSPRSRTSSRTCAVELSAARRGGGAFTYGADYAPDRRARRASPRGTDLLMIEATLPRPERSGLRGHLTPREAGRARPPGRRRAARAHAHLRRARRAWARAEAEAAFGGAVHVAAAGAVYEV